MRLALALLLLVHGIAHLLEFAESFRLAPAAGIPYRTTLLDGWVDVGDGGVRLLGILWLALAVGFVAVAAGMALDTTWWVDVAAVGAMVSLLMTLLEAPRAQIGLWVNIFILIALLFSY
jgi:hypothetical protein